MKNRILLTLAALMAGTVLNAQFNATPSAGGIIESGGGSSSADFYGQGNDDDFAEYGISSFSLTSGDFGGTLTSIESVTMTLTHNDRFFTTDGNIEFFFTTDDLSNDFTSLSFDAGIISGINATQYSYAPMSLGTIAYAQKPGGETDTYTLNFGASALADLLSEINAGSEFQIILGAAEGTTAATFSGLGNTFDVGDPILTISATAVPEPSVYAAILGLLALGFVAYRRRK